MEMYQINILYTLNLHNVLCQLYLNFKNKLKTTKKQQQMELEIIFKKKSFLFYIPQGPRNALQCAERNQTIYSGEDKQVVHTWTKIKKQTWVNHLFSRVSVIFLGCLDGSVG